MKSRLPSSFEVRQYIGITLCVFTLWGCSWFVLKDLVLPGGFIFTMTLLVIWGYIFGHTLDRYTRIPPLIGMVLVGAIYRNVSDYNYLNYSAAVRLDYHLRRVCAVIILTKGALGWNWEYMRRNAKRVFTLATIPWLIECLSWTLFTNLLLGFPWYWGLQLGSILSSLSPAVFTPSLLNFVQKGYDSKKIAPLLTNSGGLDTVFTVGMFGMINSAIFYPASLPYTITKAILAIFIGIALGVAWAYVIDHIPAHDDKYAATIKSVLLFGASLLFMYAAPFIGWGGTNGVFIMVSAGASATLWSQRGWPINANPVVEVYSAVWRIFEPILFTLGGFYLEVAFLTWNDFGLILCCLFLSLSLRLMMSFTIVKINSEYNIKECIFISICWIPKAVVETAMVRLAMDSALNNDSSTSEDYRIARLQSNIIIIAVLITSFFSSILINVFGPILLDVKKKVESIC